MDRIVMHIDVNSAFLSWSAVDLLNKGNKLDIRTIPSIIAYTDSKRHAIVLAASIPAKKNKIKTAEPVYMAEKKYKNLKIVSPDYKLYENMSNKFHELVKNYTPDYEYLSVDECFIEYGPVRNLYGDPIEFAYKLKDEIKNKLGFTVNVGVGNNKLLAKMASDFEKPDKVHTLFNSEIKTKMYPLPIKELYGCGRQSCKELEKLNIKTIGDLANFDKNILIKKLKTFGSHIHDYANGIDNSKVGNFEAKDSSISKETTFTEDITNKEKLLKELAKLTKEVSLTLRNRNKYTRTIAVNIKYYDFKTKRKQKTYNTSMRTEDEIYIKIKEIFNSFWNKKPIRLIGVKLSNFSENKLSQICMFEEEKQEEDNLQKIIDDINKKYGKDSIYKER